MYPNLPADVLKAKQLYHAALSCFNEVSERADGRFAVDAAIYTLNAAEFSLRAAIERAKKLCPGGLEQITVRGMTCQGH
mgnify:CR=1 FL=1